MTESDWNMSDATMYAISTASNECNSAHFRGDLNDYYRYLRILYKELYPFMSKKDLDLIDPLLETAKTCRGGEMGINAHFAVDLALHAFAGKSKMLLRTGRDSSKAMEELT